MPQRLAVNIWTIGCQMNEADARRLGDELDLVGFEPCDAADAADLVVLYSCVVRQAAENKVHNQLMRLRDVKRQRPALKIALAGCMAGEETAALQQTYPFVDLFISPKADISLRNQLLDLLDLDERYRHEPDGAQRTPGVSAGVTIHQGCNRRCTYCIIPFRRGGERSRQPAEIRAEVAGLVARGTREVVLLSQIVERYGWDLEPRRSLAELLTLLNDVPGLERIRFLTSYPNDFGPDLIEAVATLPHVCEDINLPIQAGDDTVLRRMARGYKVADYVRVVDALRARMPEIGISTDIIVGFPGETAEQFENTLRTMERVRWDVVHVAMFSPREGTVAATWPDDVPRAEKKRRLHAVEELQARIAAEINARLVGRTLEVLVEGQAKGRWYGRTRTNKLAFFDHPEPLAGALVAVRIGQASAWALQGELVAVTQQPPAVALPPTLSQGERETADGTPTPSVSPGAGEHSEAPSPPGRGRGVRAPSDGVIPLRLAAS
ncbi:MAG TPA: tRNA (N6-isopentenyl adenosine(37)-C2)-methylthiotransferase MiaB [Chloroflexota bacterium]|nr:tRNA (N6-isopentenyl adenosine(37)-C2)-methylthiotransferase MiaB [Chloroflexota bacterium]